MGIAQACFFQVPATKDAVMPVGNFVGLFCSPKKNIIRPIDKFNK